MFLIDCPYCGERDQSEFANRGEVRPPHPEAPERLSDEEWADFIFMRAQSQGAAGRALVPRFRLPALLLHAAQYGNRRNPRHLPDGRDAAQGENGRTGDTIRRGAHRLRERCGQGHAAGGGEAVSGQIYRLDRGGLIDRSHIVRFRFDGRTVTGFAGDTIASALIAHGEHMVARSFKYHRPRGILGAGSEEPAALVQIGADLGPHRPEYPRHGAGNL
jgi:hypothetical protein